MKRFLLMMMAMVMLLCFAGCNNGETEQTTTATTTAPSTTDPNTIDNNKIAEAKLDIDGIVLCLSTYADFDSAIQVGADDTIGDVLQKFEDDGAYIETFHVNKEARFFDYVTENPDYAPGGSLYLLKDDADWLSLYVD